MADAPQSAAVGEATSLAPRRIFVRPPVPVVLDVDGAERTIVVSRITARHAGAWEALWAEYKPTLMDWTPAQWEQYVRSFCKAAIPEPDPLLRCPEHCQCRMNEGMHAVIDRLGREQIDILFGAVMEANAPKDGAPRTAPSEVARSVSTRRSRGSSWLDALWRRRSISPSRRSESF